MRIEGRDGVDAVSRRPGGRKSFILGLGMPKAGTTWLFDFLQHHPQVRMGFEKEMHILHAPEYGSLANAALHIPWRKFDGISWLRQQLVRAWYRSDWERYFCYFSSLLTDGKIATGDLSPSNQKMSVASMTRTRDEFRSRGMRVLALFIVRDPVERLLSEVRYSEKLLSRYRFRSPTGRPCEELFLERLSIESDALCVEPEIDRRMCGVFDATERLILLHEELFEQPTIDVLTEMAGISALAANTKRRVNATPGDALISATTRRAAARRFAPTYQWAASRFGTDRITKLWPNAGIALAEASSR